MLPRGSSRCEYRRGCARMLPAIIISPSDMKECRGLVPLAIHYYRMSQAGILREESQWMLRLCLSVREWISHAQP